MATTRLISIHHAKGKAAPECIRGGLSYIMNPAKTGDGRYVSCYECDPQTAAAEFILSKRIYEDITGRSHKNDVLMYQIRQSFLPGEITPELANKIGYELAMRFTKGKHAFVVATHIDKAHIHTHIDFNSTSIDCTKKFRDFNRSAVALAKISDRLCLENGLSIVENPKGKSASYNKWLGNDQPLSHAEKFRLCIDEVLATKPSSFDAFLTAMQASGYEEKYGKHLAFKSTKQQRFTRLRSLGEGYSEQEIRGMIDGTIPLKERKPIQKKPTPQPQNKVNLLIDIQAKMADGKGKGYEHWAKIFNVKQMAQTINFLREKGLLQYSDLEKRASEIAANFNDLGASIKGMESRLAELSTLKKHIINYAKTREIYIAYRKAGYSKKFYNEHREQIDLHKASKAHFDALGIKKLPTVKSMNVEYAELLAAKKRSYREYYAMKNEMRDVLRAKANVDWLLGYDRDLAARRKSCEER